MFCSVGVFGSSSCGSRASSWYGTTSTLSRFIAARVAAMLRSMYGRSLVDSAGCTWKRWTKAGIGGAGHDRHEAPQTDGDDRQPPAPLPHVDDEQDGGQQRDEEQQLDGRAAAR